VDTRAHIGLLTRNIVIEPEYSTDDTDRNAAGANNVEFDTRVFTTPLALFADDYTFSGPGGTLVPDYKPPKANPTESYEACNRCYVARDQLLDIPLEECTSKAERIQWFKLRRSILALDPADLTAAELKAFEECITVGGNSTTDLESIASRLFFKVHTQPVTGCWQLGTAGRSGANALLGAQTMFRYGSSTVINGVRASACASPSRIAWVLRLIPATSPPMRSIII
jgi:hypothetical protein